MAIEVGLVALVPADVGERDVDAGRHDEGERGDEGRAPAAPHDHGTRAAAATSDEQQRVAGDPADDVDGA